MLQAPRNPFANGLFSIFNCVICETKTRHDDKVIYSCNCNIEFEEKEERDVMKKEIRQQDKSLNKVTNLSVCY